MTAITVHNLCKRYGERLAVNGASFAVDDGEVVAVLGRNGAGKTTTLEILEGYRPRSGGEVHVLGVDPAQAGAGWRALIGLVPQSTSLDEQLTVAETLRVYAAPHRRPRPVGETLELVGLAGMAGKRVGMLSGGQKRRLDLAAGIVGRPRVLFLDEPTTGFDPAARRQAWDTVARLCHEGMSVVLTTHYLEEAEVLADRVVVLSGGTVVADAPPAELRRRLGGGSVIRLPAALGIDRAQLPARLSEATETASGDVVLTSHDVTRDLSELLDWARTRAVRLDGLNVSDVSLEDVYLTLTGDSHGCA